MAHKEHDCEFTCTYTAEVTVVTKARGTNAGLAAVERRMRGRTRAALQQGIKDLLGVDDVVIQNVKVFRRDEA